MRRNIFRSNSDEDGNITKRLSLLATCLLWTQEDNDPGPRHMGISVSRCGATSSWSGVVLSSPSHCHCHCQGLLIGKVHMAILPSLECRLGVEGGTRAQGVEAAGLCSGLDGGPQTFIQVRIPGTCDMTLLGKRTFADVIVKDLEMSSSWTTWVGPKSSDRCLDKKKERGIWDGETQREGPEKTAVMWPQTHPQSRMSSSGDPSLTTSAKNLFPNKVTF